MALYFSPVGNSQVVDTAGNPLVGGYWNVYLAGTTTPVATYTSNTGGTAQPTNIELDSAGRPANPIWLTGGVPVKFRLYSAAAALLLTIDNVSGVNDPAGATAQDQWVLYGAAPTYISATSFSVTGDQTNTFHVGRRIKSTNSGGTVYSSITASAYASVTTVTVSNDSGTLDSGLSAVSYGLIAATNTSAPTTLVRTGAVTSSGLTMTTDRILGRTTASTGAIEELTAAQVSAFAAAATTSAQGVAELATTAEVQTGTDTARVPSVDSMRNGLIVRGTAASATGTSVAYSSIPSWVSQIDCYFSGVSSNNTGHLLVQIGTGGSATTSGYSSSSVACAGTNTVVGVASISGFCIYTGVAADTFTGHMTLKKMTGNQWSSTHAGNKSGYVSTGGGDVTLAGTLDYLRFLNTTGDFDAGTVNISYR